MAVRALFLTSGEQTEHRPQHVRDRQGLFLLGVGEHHAHPALVVRTGTSGDRRQLSDGVGAPELRGAEPGFGGLRAQIAQQGLVVHPVQGGVGVGVEGGSAARGQRQEIALLPLHEPLVDRGEATAVQDVVQLGGGVRAGADPLPGPDPHETGQQPGTGRRPRRDAQLLGQVQRDDPRRMAGADRVGGLGVLEVARVVGPILETPFEAVLGHVRRGGRDGGIEGVGGHPRSSDRHLRLLAIHGRVSYI